VAEMTPHQTGVLAAIGMACLVASVLIWPFYIGVAVVLVALTLMVIFAIVATYESVKEMAENRQQKRKWK
jgi:membrane protein implicated in regulation of membrane protease activity